MFEDEAIVVAELECGVSVERGKFVILSNSLRDREAALRQLEHTPDPTIDPCGWRNRLAVNATLERGGCKNHPSYQPVVGYGSVLCAPALTTKAASDNGEETDGVGVNRRFRREGRIRRSSWSSEEDPPLPDEERVAKR